MDQSKSCSLTPIDYFSLCTLQDAIDQINKLHPLEKNIQSLILKCAASNLTPMLLYYNGNLHLKTLDNLNNTPSIVGSYSYKGMIEIQDYKLGIERPLNNFMTHRVIPLAIDLLSPTQGSPEATQSYLNLPYYFSPYLYIPDESNPETPLHYSEGCCLEISDLEFDSIGVKLAVDMLKQQIKSRHLTSGRYTVEEASTMVAEATSESQIEIEQILFSAIKSSSLTAHLPGRSATIKLQLQQEPHLIYSAEIFWNKLNEWLKVNEPEIHFKFPDPALPPAQKSLAQGSSDTNSKLTDMAPTHLIHKLTKAREHKLAAEILAAKERAPSPDSIQSVWNELVKMAEKKEMSLLENCELDEIKYGSPQHPEIFTKKALRSFLDRKNPTR